ncbi:MAG TPA: 50S ribosomal protein L29 [Anaerolineae bacterium]|jgi:large subunit ribosomal protein L29
MKLTELRALSDAELQKQLDDLYESLFKFRFQRAAGQLSDTNKLPQVQREIARVKTLMRERALAVTRGKVGA